TKLTIAIRVQTTWSSHSFRIWLRNSSSATDTIGLPAGGECGGVATWAAWWPVSRPVSWSWAVADWLMGSSSRPATDATARSLAGRLSRYLMVRLLTSGRITPMIVGDITVDSAGGDQACPEVEDCRSTRMARVPAAVARADPSPPRPAPGPRGR